jgi:hypothetical protein
VGADRKDAQNVGVNSFMTNGLVSSPLLDSFSVNKAKLHWPKDGLRKIYVPMSADSVIEQNETINAVPLLTLSVCAPKSYRRYDSGAMPLSIYAVLKKLRLELDNSAAEEK